MITEDILKNNEQIRTYITKAADGLWWLLEAIQSTALLSHVTKGSAVRQRTASGLGYGSRKAELAWIAGYLHDISIINRIDHAQSGAVMAFRILDNLGRTQTSFPLLSALSATMMKARLIQ